MTLSKQEMDILNAAMALRAEGVTEWTGNQCAMKIKEMQNKRLLPARGSLFRALWELEKRRLLAGSWEHEDTAEQEGRPRRKYHRLTRSGLQAAISLDPDDTPLPAGRAAPATRTA